MTELLFVAKANIKSNTAEFIDCQNVCLSEKVGEKEQQVNYLRFLVVFQIDIKTISAHRDFYFGWFYYRKEQIYP